MNAAAVGPRTLRIGITIGLRAANESLWINGIKQNALFLAKLLQASPLGHDVWLLNTTDIAITPALPWDQARFHTAPLSVDEHWDVLIELGGQVSAEQTRALKARGTRLISYCCSAEYVLMMEAMLFQRPISGPDIFVNQQYDDIWIVPQASETSRSYFEILRRRPAKVVPFVWDPMAIEEACVGFENEGRYRPSDSAKRLTVIEPNRDVLKFCLYPILAIEQVFRDHPDRIGFVHVANAETLVAAERDFAAVMRQLDLVMAGKISFIGNVETPVFLAGHSDVVISHQWGLPLNYFHLECCWLGYPLIHNSSLIADLGYAYPENNMNIAAERLSQALHHHDADFSGYRRRQREGIGRFLATNPSLIQIYDDLLLEVMQAPSRR